MSPIKFPTKCMFQILRVSKLDKMMPFWKLFMKRPSHFTAVRPNLIDKKLSYCKGTPHCNALRQSIFLLHYCIRGHHLRESGGGIHRPSRTEMIFVCTIPLWNVHIISFLELPNAPEPYFTRHLAWLDPKTPPITHWNDATATVRKIAFLRRIVCIA